MRRSMIRIPDADYLSSKVNMMQEFYAQVCRVRGSGKTFRLAHSSKVGCENAGEKRERQHESLELQSLP